MWADNLGKTYNSSSMASAAGRTLPRACCLCWHAAYHSTLRNSSNTRGASRLPPVCCTARLRCRALGHEVDKQRYKQHPSPMPCADGGSRRHDIYTAPYLPYIFFYTYLPHLRDAGLFLYARACATFPSVWRLFYVGGATLSVRRDCCHTTRTHYHIGLDEQRHNPKGGQPSLPSTHLPLPRTPAHCLPLPHASHIFASLSLFLLHRPSACLHTLRLARTRTKAANRQSMVGRANGASGKRDAPARGAKRQRPCLATISTICAVTHRTIYRILIGRPYG